MQAAWLEYQSRFPHLSAWYRAAPQFVNQISLVNGKKAGTDINLYKLFTEQSFNLLRAAGECGIVIPSGIYTDLGAKQLREMLFNQTQVHALFGLSNERFIFEGVDHRFKICFLVFRKGATTTTFEGAFRINPREAVTPEQLSLFFTDSNAHLMISVPLMRRLSPDSFSVTEFRNNTDVQIAEKMLRFPLSGDEIAGHWQLKFSAEFHMTNDSHLFRTTPGPGRLPLYEGKMIHQFTNQWENTAPRYWIDEKQGRQALLGRSSDNNQRLGYQNYRVAYRAIARNTDSRTLISTVLPKKVFCGHSLNVAVPFSDNTISLYLTAILNSLVYDFSLRQKVSADLTMFFIYQTPVPRLTTGDRFFAAIVERAAWLICTTPEFDDLAKEVGLAPLPPSQLEEQALRLKDPTRCLWTCPLWHP